MVLRYLLHRLINNPQLIEKLSESYPIRRAAQLTAYVLQQGKESIKEAAESQARKKVDQFSQTFTQELKEGFKKIQDQQKQQK